MEDEMADIVDRLPDLAGALGLISQEAALPDIYGLSASSLQENAFCLVQGIIQGCNRY
jgi:hypothetical protein